MDFLFRQLAVRREQHYAHRPGWVGNYTRSLRAEAPAVGLCARPANQNRTPPLYKLACYTSSSSLGDG